jgi:hypothetical protein
MTIFSYPDFIKPALRDKTKYVIIRAGRRVGKTYNVAQWILEQLLRNSNTKGLWVDTVQSNISRYIDRYFVKILGDFDDYKIDNQKYIIKFGNGSILDLGSAERPENLEGFEYDFVVLNEAGIILKKPELWLNTIQPMCKNALVKIIGTPKGYNYYYDLSTNAVSNPQEWAEYVFSTYDSPFWKPEQIEKIKSQIPWPVFKSEYLAEFTTGNEENVLLTSEQIEKAINRNPIRDLENPQIMAVDVALKHDKAIWLFHDMTKIWKLETLDPKESGTVQTPDITAKTLTLAQTYDIGSDHTVIDSDGIGAGVVGELEKYHETKVVEFHSNRGIPESFKYPEFLEPLNYYTFGNIRCQLAFVLRHLIINQGFEIIDDTELINQLSEIRYKIKKGRFYLESKDEMKKRIGKSPDKADALIYSMYFYLYRLDNGVTVALYR